MPIYRLTANSITSIPTIGMEVHAPNRIATVKTNLLMTVMKPQEGQGSKTKARQESSTSNSTRKQKAREKTVALPHKKRRVRSQVEAQADMARSVAKFAEGQERRCRKGKEEERRRDDIFLQFKREEAETNRQHELKLSEMFATTNKRPHQDQQPYEPHNPGSLVSRYTTA